jgi:hypothetical protein
MDWTLEEIRTRFRKLTGKLSNNQMTDAEINELINDFYTLTLPKSVSSPYLQGWWEYTCAAAEDEIVIADEYLILKSPFSVDGKIHTLEEDPYHFYRRWPETEIFAQSEPYRALLYGRTLILRPPPDGAYDLKAAAIIAPDPLSTDASVPLDATWGPIIATGAAIVDKVNEGDFDAANTLNTVYQSFKQVSDVPGYIQLGDNRSTPRF